MSLDFIKEPAVFERAFGQKWGLRVWRGLVMLAVVAAIGGAVFGGLHGYATLKADFSPHVETAQSSQRPKVSMRGFTIDSKGDSVTLNGCFDQEYDDVKLNSREGRGLSNNCKTLPQVAQNPPSITNNAPSINTLNQSGGNNTINIGPPRRPEGLYQSGQMVGLVGGAKPGPSPNQVIFQNLRISSGTVDLSAPLEFQNAIVRCPLPSPRGMAAMTAIMMAGETTCDIVGQRQ